MNQPPVFGALSLVTVAEGATQTVTLSATDPDMDPLTFSLPSPLAFASLSGATLTLSPDFTQAGSYMLAVRVTDGRTPVDGVLPVTVTNTNRAPTIAPISDVMMSAGTTRTVVVSATDPDGDSVTVSAASLPGYASLDGGVITLAPSLAVVATDTISVTASDGTLSATDAFDVTVSAPPNQAPVLSAIEQVNASNVALDAGVSLFSAPKVRASVDDPENAQVRLEVEVVSSSAAFTGTATQAGALGAEGQLELVLNTLPAGTYKWQLRALDASGAASAWTGFAGGAAAFTILSNPITGTVSVANAAAAVNTSTVTLTLAATSSAGAVTTMAFSNDGVTFSAPEAFATTKAGWALSSGDGTKTVYVRFLDGAANTFVANDSIVLDTVAPQLSNFSINNGAAFTADAGVTLTYLASDTGSGLQARAASNDGMTFTAVGTSPASWTLSSGAGTKSVTLRVTDAAGNQAIATDTIAVDNAAPTLSNVSINAGASATNSTAATLSLSVSDGAGSGPAQVCFSGAVASPGCVPYGAGGPYLVTLTSADGSKVVSVTVQDAAGNTSAAVSDGITLDTVPPTLTGLSLSGGLPFINTLAGSYALTGASDAVGLAQIEFSTNGGATYAAPVTYSTTGPITLPSGDGLKTVHARVIDAAGNRSAAVSDTITLDTTPPIATVAAARATNQPTADVTITAGMDASGVTRVCAKVAAVGAPVTPPTGASDPCVTMFSGVVNVAVSTGGAGDKRVHVWVVDGAGNVAASAATTDVFYDLTAPGAPSGLTATARNHGLDLSWTAASDGAGSGIGGYEVGVATTAGGPYTYRAVGSMTSAFVELSNGVTWYVVVRARDLAGNVGTATSNQASATPYFPWAWQQRFPIPGELTDVEVFDAGTGARWIVTGDNGALFTSDDALATLTRRDALREGRQSGVGLVAGTVYVFGEAGQISRSQDRAVSFTLESVGADAGRQSDGGLAEVRDLTVVGAPAATHTLVAVTSLGEVWRQVVTPTARGAWIPTARPTTEVLRGVSGCSGAPSGPCGAGSTFVLAVGAAGTVLRSTDSGQTWSAVVPPNFSHNVVAVLHRPGTNQFYVGSAQTPSGTTPIMIYDAVANTLTTDPAITFPVNDLKLSLDGQTVLVMATTGQFRFPHTAPPVATNFVGYSGYTSIAGTSLGLTAMTGAGGALRVINGGSHLLRTAGQSYQLNAVAYRQGSPTNLYAAAVDGGVLATTDSGATWVHEYAGFNANLLAIDATTWGSLYSYAIAVGTNGRVQTKRTTNAWGAHPQLAAVIPNGITLRGVACTTAVHCFIVGSGGTIYELNVGNPSIGEGTLSATTVNQDSTGEYRALVHWLIGSSNQPATVVGRDPVGRGIVRRFNSSGWQAEQLLPTSAPFLSDIGLKHGNTAHQLACGNMAASAGGAGALVYSTDTGATWTTTAIPGTSGVTISSCANASGTDDWFFVGSNGFMVKGTRGSTGAFSFSQLVRLSNVSLTGVATYNGSPLQAFVVGLAGTVLVTDVGGE